MVVNYFTILEDLLLASRLPVFSRRAKRKLVTHRKFYYFDVGVFRAIRPRGPLDSPGEIDGAALETLVLQELRAINDNLELGYDLHFWRTKHGMEVDFYGGQDIQYLDQMVALPSEQAFHLLPSLLDGSFGH